VEAYNGTALLQGFSSNHARQTVPKCYVCHLFLMHIGSFEQERLCSGGMGPEERFWIKME